LEVAYSYRQSRLFIERRILVIDPIGDFAESIGNFSGSIGNFFDSIGNLQDPNGNFSGSIGNFFGSIGNFRNPLMATFPSTSYRPSHLVIGHRTTLETVFRAIVI